MKLPDYLKLAVLLNAPDTRQQALTTLASEGPDRSSETLRALLPYLSLPTLLSLRDSHATTTLGPLITQSLYDLLDSQRDWVVSPECPAELRDLYLVRMFGQEWDLVEKGMEAVAETQMDEVKEGMILEPPEDENGDEADDGEGPCLSKKDFEEELNRSTGGLLAHVDWSNVVLGGGAVLSILTGKADSEAYSTSDLDLFLYGLEPDELIPKVASLIDQITDAVPDATQRHKYDHLSRDARLANIRTKKWTEDNNLDWQKEHKGEILVIKGFNAITLVPPLSVSPRRTIQIVLQSHTSVFDALAWFDLDACAVGYTGKAVVALPRAIRSLSLGDWTGGINLLDPRLARKGASLPDPSGSMLATRAIKYLQRGFSLAVPPAALVAVEHELEHPFARLVRKARRHAKQEFFAKDTHEDFKVFPAAGLNGLLRREQRFVHQVVKKKRKAAEERGEDLSSTDESNDSEESGHWSEEYDYGSTRARWVKRVSDRELKLSENTDLFQDFWTYNTKQLDGAISGLMWELNANKETLDRDERDLYRYSYGKEKAKLPALAPAYESFQEFVVPYVTSFDPGNAIGLLESRIEVEQPPIGQKAQKIEKARTRAALMMATDEDNEEEEEEDDEEEELDEADDQPEEEQGEADVDDVEGAGPDWPAELSLRETALSFQILEAFSLEARRVQYVVKLPRSVLPLFDVADVKMKALLDKLLDPAAHAESSNIGLSVAYEPAFSGDVEATVANVVMKLEKRAEITAPDGSDVHALRTEPLRPFVPDCFPGPTRRGEKIQLGAFKKTSADVATDRHLLSRLTPSGSTPASPEDPSSNWVYRVATLAGLWQFKGLDPDIDKALNILWQAWTIFSRAATTLPEEAPNSLFANLRLTDSPMNQAITADTVYKKLAHARKRDKVALMRYLEQPTPAAVLLTMRHSLEKLQMMVKDDSEGSSTALKTGVYGVWSGDRKRWIEQWIQGEEML
ncbi:hypothetical protein JCM10908_006739 [Rhodotorula pacifica]|uniref:uncharacterized protein n=1 Tax=Rhodotorula pacifica TaxID=1495444 RepID=UPI00317B602D